MRNAADAQPLRSDHDRVTRVYAQPLIHDRAAAARDLAAGVPVGIAWRPDPVADHIDVSLRSVGQPCHLSELDERLSPPYAAPPASDVLRHRGCGTEGAPHSACDYPGVGIDCAHGFPRLKAKPGAHAGKHEGQGKDEARADDGYRELTAPILQVPEG